MPWYHYLAWFFGGVLLCNAIPHFVSGVTGRPFQSPFAKPPGKGLSSPTVNVLWGEFNIVAGYVLICRTGDFHLRNPLHAAVVGAGVLVMAVLAARAFGRFHGRNQP